MKSRAAPLLVLLLALVAELVLLYPRVFLHAEVLSSAGLAYGMAPWKGHMPATTPPLRGNPGLSDDMILFTPWDAAARAAIVHGDVPLWNSGSGCGMPLLANNQSAVLAPSQALRWVWDSRQARTVGLLLKSLIAAAGMFLLLRRWRLPPSAAAIGAAAWANSAALTVWLLYPLAEAAAWFPWLLLGVSQLLGIGGSARLAGGLTTTLATGALLLAGHLPTAAQLLAAAAGGTAAVLVWRPQARRRIGVLAGAVLAAFCLAAPQLLPTAAYVGYSHARLARGGDAPLATQHLPVEAAWSWLVPRGFGSPERDGYRGAINFDEATATVGIAPLLLAALAIVLVPGRREIAVAALAAVTAATAYGLPPFPWLVSQTPLLRWAAAHRFVIVTQWAIAALAACGAAKLGQVPRRRLLLAAAAGGGGLLVLASLHPALRSVGADLYAALSARAVLLAAAELAATVAAITLAAFGLARLARLVLIALTLAAGVLLGWGFNPSIAPSAIPGATAETRRLDRLRQGGRVLPVGWVMRPNTGLLAGLPTLTGFDDLLPERYFQFAQAAQLDALDARQPFDAGSVALIRRAAATLVIADRPIGGPGLEPLSDFAGPTLWAARVSGAHPLAGWYPRATAVPDPAHAFAVLSRTRLVDDDSVLAETVGRPLPGGPGLAMALSLDRDGPNRVALNCDQPRLGVLVLREAADPGWRVSIDGSAGDPLVIDGMFLGALVPAGPHRVVFEYRPLEWRVGLALAALGGLALLAFAVVIVRSRGLAR